MLFLRYSHGRGAHFSLAFDMGGVHPAGERVEENLAGEGFRSFLFGSLTSLRFFQFPACCYQYSSLRTGDKTHQATLIQPVPAASGSVGQRGAAAPGAAPLPNPWHIWILGPSPSAAFEPCAPTTPYWTLYLPAITNLVT